MKRLLTLAGTWLLALAAIAQNPNKLIKEENVLRIVATLAADDMMGRSALQPEHINKAADFISSEFKKIGLQPLDGQSGFRQEFSKTRVRPLTQQVVIDGQAIPASRALIVSEQSAIRVSSGLNVHVIAYDSTIANPAQAFFSKAMPLMGDTASSLMLIDNHYEAQFQLLKQYFGERFTNNQKAMKVFVLGVASASSYSIEATQQLSPIVMANVVGQLPGKSKAAELVVFSGHYDHIGIQRKAEGDSIANGADDDASGTTAVIELARYFKKKKDRARTLIFVAFTAEEIGGYGSQHFSRQLNPDQVVAMFNIEMIGKPSKWGPNHAFITGYERSDFGDILQKNVAGTEFQFKPDPYPEQDLFYRSDNATLARLGVPAHTISTDEIDIDKHYHKVSDEVSTLNMANLTTTIRAIALSAHTMVEGTDAPKRIDKSTVR